MKQIRDLVLVTLSSILFSTAVLAEETLTVENNSINFFAGTYQAGADRVDFASVKGADDRLQLVVEINGEIREAFLSLPSDSLELTYGNAGLTESEQELMYETAQAVGQYVGQQRNESGEHVVFLVSTMGYWSDMNWIR